MTPGMLQRLAPILEQSDEVIRFEGLNGVVRMSADAPDAPGYARTVGDAITQLQHYSAYKILMSTSLANRIAQDQAFEPLLCFNELELEVTEISPRECTKREGIQSVLDALDPHHGTVYGIGDASNDVSLMNAVDVASPWATHRTSSRKRPTMSPTASTTTRRHRARTLWAYLAKPLPHLRPHGPIVFNRRARRPNVAICCLHNATMQPIKECENPCPVRLPAF